jgi:hypothetical protein
VQVYWFRCLRVQQDRDFRKGTEIVGRQADEQERPQRAIVQPAGSCAIRTMDP